MMTNTGLLSLVIIIYCFVLTKCCVCDGRVQVGIEILNVSGHRELDGTKDPSSLICHSVPEL